jgi:hypothetical protein
MIEDPVFETGAKTGSLTYKGWDGDFEHLLTPTEEIVARYDIFRT